MKTELTAEQRVGEYIQGGGLPGAGAAEDPVGQLLQSHATLTRLNTERVDLYLSGGRPNTPERVRALLQTIWAVTHGQQSKDIMLAELSFLSGVTVHYLQDYAKLLEERAGDE